MPELDTITIKGFKSIAAIEKLKLGATVAATRMGRARTRDRRHGVKGWDVVRDSIERHLKTDAGCCVTTFVDYYGLPKNGPRAWPGRLEADGRPLAERGSWVQQALRADLAEALGGEFEARRFIPFVVMHEFEALLFSAPEIFSEWAGAPEMKEEFQAIRDAFETPEEINDSLLTAPSKRVQELVPRYSKSLNGPIAAQAIGLATIRTECPHFERWLQTLEAWPHSH